MKRSLTGVSLLLILMLLSACVATPKKDLALERVRAELDSLKSNPELAGYAPLALGEAERALRNAELATGDDLYRSYLVYMADRRIQIARTMAEREQYDLTLDKLQDEHTAMLIKASQMDADQARKEAERAASTISVREMKKKISKDQKYW